MIYIKHTVTYDNFLRGILTLGRFRLNTHSVLEPDIAVLNTPVRATQLTVALSHDHAIAPFAPSEAISARSALTEPDEPKISVPLEQDLSLCKPSLDSPFTYSALGPKNPTQWPKDPSS